jgi:hypothetical protein
MGGLLDDDYLPDHSRVPADASTLGRTGIDLKIVNLQVRPLTAENGSRELRIPMWATNTHLRIIPNWPSSVDRNSDRSSGFRPRSVMQEFAPISGLDD